MESIKKVLVLAGGFDQIALINELKARGCEVILADYYLNPPAKEFADKHFQVSTLDEEAIYNLAIQENVDIITTACTDQALLTVARVSERIGLQTYITEEAGLNVTNKAYMKKKFIENDIPTARGIVMENKDTIGYITDIIKEFPLVVKPCDCNSSKGVTLVKNSEQLQNAINHAFELSRSQKVIVEEYIVGREISVDVWVDRDSAKVLSVSETIKKEEETNNFTIQKSVYPFSSFNMYYDDILKIANQIAEGFHIKNSPMLIQALVNDDGIFVIEFSARMGGGSKYKFIEYMSGINIMGLYVDLILGKTVDRIVPNYSNQYMELHYLYTRPGKITKLIGFDNCLADGRIKEMFQYKTLGTEINNCSTSSDRAAGILIVSDSKKELELKKKKVYESIDILDNSSSILYKYL